MTIEIETPHEESLILFPRVADTVNDIKAMIQHEIRIPPDQQRLVFAGKHLENNCTLLDYSIKPESKLLLECKYSYLCIYYSTEW